MDVSRFLGKFRDATRDHLRRMNELLLELEQPPVRADDVEELLREIHTLKGESRMMGYGDMSDVSHAVEDLLKAQEAAGFAELGSVTDVLFAAFDDVEKLLREKLGEGPSGVDVAARCRELRAAAGLREPEPAEASDAADDAEAAPAEAGRAVAAPAIPEALPDLPDAAAGAGAADGEGFGLGDLEISEADGEESGEWALPAEGEADPEAAMREAFGVPTGLAQEIGEGGQVAAPGERAVSVGGGPQKFLARWRDAAQGRLHALQSALVALGRRHDDGVALGALADEAGGLAEESRQLGFEDVAFLADSCAALGAWGRASSRGLPDEQLGALVAAVETLGRLVVEKLGGEPARADVGTLVARLTPPAQEVPAAAPRTADAARAPAPASQGARAQPVEETIRVSVDKLDRLGMLSSDIYLSHAAAESRLRHLRSLIDGAKTHARLVAQARQAAGAATSPAGAGGQEAHDALLQSARAMRRGLQDLLRRERDELLRTGHSVVELREHVRELQMLPVSTLFDLYPRMVRDLARELGVQVRLVIEGAEVELDRRILDEIRDPMVHLIRNAVDHGIEPPAERQRKGKPAQGTLTLAARAEGDHVVLEVRDDGGGIDPQAIRNVAVKRGVLTREEADELTDERALDLVFAAGFSSKEQVSDISGRGVGLDVVRDKVDRLEGTLTVWSRPGQGTRFVLRLPLTLAMARLILVRAGGVLAGLPAALVDEVVRLPEQAVSRIEGYEAMEWKDRSLPLVSLAGLLDREPEAPERGLRHVAVVHFDEHYVGLVVDRFAGEREAVVKRLDDFLGRLPNVAGATILTSGDIVTVLHVPQLIASTMGVEPSRLAARVRVTQGPARAGRKRLLVVDDSIIVRDMMKGVLESAGFDVTLAVDGMDGLEKQLAGGYDVVITDVEMPRMDGFELTRSLRQNPALAQVPIVIVTTLDSAESRDKGMKAGASAYLVKNLLDMSHLVGTIERLAS